MGTLWTLFSVRFRGTLCITELVNGLKILDEPQYDFREAFLGEVIASKRTYILHIIMFKELLCRLYLGHFVSLIKRYYTIISLLQRVSQTRFNHLCPC